MLTRLTLSPLTVNTLEQAMLEHSFVKTEDFEPTPDPRSGNCRLKGEYVSMFTAANCRIVYSIGYVIIQVVAGKATESTDLSTTESSIVLLTLIRLLKGWLVYLMRRTKR